MGTNLQGYHLLWPDLPTFSQLQFTAPAPLPLGKSGGLLVYPSSNPRMKPGEKERSEHEASFLSFVFVFLQSPNPLSLAATNGVSVDFPSFSYSDVSVR